MNKLISVILPVYNGEKFLERCIKSVLNQLYKNLELIIVDDASTDNSKNIILKFSKIDKRIKYIFLEKNSGSPAYPHNIGFTASSGNFISYIDQDDEWLPSKLKKQLNHYLNNINKRPIGLVTCYSMIIDTIKNSSYISQINHSYNFKEVISNVNNYCSGNSSMFIPRYVIERIGDRDVNVGVYEDIDFVIRLVSAGFFIEIVKEPLFKYYVHNYNFSNRGFAFFDKNKAKKMSVWLENFVIKNKDNFSFNYCVLSSYLRGVSIYKFFTGEKKQSLIYLLKAIRVCKLNLKNYLHLILRLIPYFYFLSFKIKYYLSK